MTVRDPCDNPVAPIIAGPIARQGDGVEWGSGVTANDLLGRGPAGRSQPRPYAWRLARPLTALLRQAEQTDAGNVSDDIPDLVNAVQWSPSIIAAKQLQ